MFCKYCGNKLDDDSAFCDKCGREISKKVETNKENIMNNTIKEEVEEDKGYGLKIFLIFSAFVLVVMLLIPVFVRAGDNTSNKQDNGNLIERTITKNDYSLNTTQDLTTYTIMITPKIDLIYCEVQCSFYTENDKLLYSDTIKKEKLTQSKTYSYTFDMGFTNALEAEYVRYNVTGRCYRI